MVIVSPDSDHWKGVIESELSSLRECKTWRVIKRSEIPSTTTPIKCKWVFKIKRDENNHISRFKTSLTACGYAQRFGRDFNETFAPVALQCQFVSCSR